MLDGLFDNSLALKANLRLTGISNRKIPDDKFTFLRKLIEVKEDGFRLIDKPKQKKCLEKNKQKTLSFKFTDKFCRDFSLLYGQKRRSKSEGNLKLLLYKNGRKKWIVETERDPRVNRTIGEYPQMSIAAAREARDKILGKR